MSIAYSRYFSELEALVLEAGRLLKLVATPDFEQTERNLADVRERILLQAPLRLVLTGEWNAGKSSLIGALTGADVKIDADVCTDGIAQIEWRGLTIVDTPGVQAENKETNHDRLARAATIGADLVLFVITNELFNPKLAKYLRYILDDNELALAGKTALIVNKIDRETNAEHMLLTEIEKVLGPHQDVPVYFCSASKLLQARTELPQFQDRFIAQSRIAALTDAIDQFVDDAGTLGRLATPLQIISDLVDALQARMTISPESNKRLELIRRERLVLQNLQRRLLDLRKTWKAQAYSSVMGQAESTVKQIGEYTNGDELEQLFASGMQKALVNIEQLHDDVYADISDAIDDAQNKLEEIGVGSLAKDIERSRIKPADQAKVAFQAERPTDYSNAGKFGKKMATPLKEGLEAAAKNPEALRKAIYSVGKTFGKKFRPWEAVKTGKTLANFAGKASKAVPFLAATLDLYLQYREEKQKEEKARYLAQLRLSLRNAFAQQAKMEADVLEAGIVRIYQEVVANALAALDARAAEVCAENNAKSSVANDLSRLGERCTCLRTQIMSGITREVPAV